jgi:hypothetical protein
MQTFVLALGLALAAAPVEPEFRAGFTPHPALVELSVPSGASSMRSLGYSSCSSASTSDTPAFAFSLPETMTDLRLVIDAPAVLVQPDGTFVCVKEPVWLKEWSPGRYQVLLYGDNPVLKAKLRLEQPERATFEVKAALAAMPEVVLSGASPQNPVFHTLTPKAVFHARSSGIGCGPETLAPLAKVKVLHSSTWSFAVRDARTVLLNPPRAAAAPTWRASGSSPASTCSGRRRRRRRRSGGPGRSR